jgi:hypothetical protein
MVSIRSPGPNGIDGTVSRAYEGQPSIMRLRLRSKFKGLALGRQDAAMGAGTKDGREGLKGHKADCSAAAIMGNASNTCYMLSCKRKRGKGASMQGYD